MHAKDAEFPRVGDRASCTEAESVRRLHNVRPDRRRRAVRARRVKRRCPAEAAAKAAAAVPAGPPSPAVRALDQRGLGTQAAACGGLALPRRRAGWSCGGGGAPAQPPAALGAFAARAGSGRRGRAEAAALPAWPAWPAGSCLPAGVAGEFCARPRPPAAPPARPAGPPPPPPGLSPACPLAFLRGFVPFSADHFRRPCMRHRGQPKLGLNARFPQT